MRQWICEEEGCESGPGTDGAAIYRTSPKGEAFRGRCERHMRSGQDEVDQAVLDIASTIERAGKEN